MSIYQNLTTVMPRVLALFTASGGTAPYVYSVVAGGAGGTINSSTGVYTAPDELNIDPAKSFDTIISTDAALVEQTTTINISSHLGMLCDIIRTELSLDADQVIIFDQKYTIPNDSRLYITVGEISSKAFASSNREEEISGGYYEVQTTNVRSIVSINIASKSIEALFKKLQVHMALSSYYSQKQQESSSFQIAKISSMINNISSIDGIAIPYRFNFTLSVQYAETKLKLIEYYDTFSNVSVETNK